MLGQTAGIPAAITISGGAWGSITGTLSAQTDLQSALDAKLASATATATYQPMLGGGSFNNKFITWNGSAWAPATASAAQELIHPGAPSPVNQFYGWTWTGSSYGWTSISSQLDSLASTRGSILYRGVSGWTVLAPGTSGTALVSAGSGADPAWSNIGTNSGTNTGDQTITLTGDVTGSGTGSFATTIGAGKVTNNMLAGSIAIPKLAITGAPNGAKFLRDDGSWQSAGSAFNPESPGAIGGTTPATGTFTTLTAGSTTSLLLGTAGSAVGNIGFRNATSGTSTLAPPTGALGTYTVTLPGVAATLATLGANTYTAAQFIDGSTDVVQLTVQSHSTQNSYPFVVEGSDGTDIFSVRPGSNGVHCTSSLFTTQLNASSGYLGLGASQGTYLKGNDGGVQGSLKLSNGAETIAITLTATATATLQMGANHATTATAQTLKSHDVTLGTGASLTLAGGKGSTAGGALILATSATTGAPVARVTVAASGEITLGNTGTAIASIKRASVTLVAGTATVSDTSTTANSVVIMARLTPGGTLGHLDYDVSAGVGYTINSSAPTETSVINITVIHYP